MHRAPPTMPTRTELPVDDSPPRHGGEGEAYEGGQEGGGGMAPPSPTATAADHPQQQTTVPPSPAAPAGGDDNEEEDDGLLFSCRCESARSVTTLLSCLRHVASGSSSGGADGGPASGSAGGGGLTQGGRRSRADLSLSHIDHTGTGTRGSSGRGKVQHATVFAGEAGLTFHVHGTARQSQASVDMQRGLFGDYYVSEQLVEVDDDGSEDEEDQEPTRDNDRPRPKLERVQGGEFCINLTTVLECLHVLGTASLDRTKLSLSYDLHDAIFRIELLEDGIMGGSGGGAAAAAGAAAGGIVSTCAIPGLAVSDDEDHEEGASGLAVAFRSSPIVARAIVKSDFLRDAIVELSDVPGTSSATIGISPGGMDLATIGYNSECQVSLPNAGNDSVFVSLECDPPRVHARTYPIHSVLSAMRGLEIATETCISINRGGMVAIQHQVLDDVGNGQPNFVDFIMGCLQDDDEDEEEMYDDEEEEENHVMSELGREMTGTQRSVDARGRLRGRGTATANAATAASASSDEDDDDEAARRRTEDLLRRLGDGSSSDEGSENDENDRKTSGENNNARPTSSADGSGSADFGQLTTEPASKSSRSQRETERRGTARRNRAGSRARTQPQSLSSDDEDRDDGKNDKDDSKKKKKKKKKKGKRGRKRPSPTTASGRNSSRRKREESGASHDSDDESTDVESQAIVVASPERNAAKSRSAGDDAPSSPELMYGDTRLGTSIDDTRKSGRSKASAFSDDDSDDDFM